MLPKYSCVVFLLVSAACSSPPDDLPVLTATMPLKLQEHLAEAHFIDSSVPVEVPPPVEWKFAEAGATWRSFSSSREDPDYPASPARVEVIEDAIRLTLLKKNGGNANWPYSGMVLSELPGLNREDWSHLIVRARAVQPGRLSLVFGSQGKLLKSAGSSLISDGEIHSYRLSVRWEHLADATWDRIGLLIVSKTAGVFDIVSAKIVPSATQHGDTAAGVSQERLVGTPGSWTEGGLLRRAVYSRTPGRVEYRIRIPHGGRFDFGLGVTRTNIPVNFRVTATVDGEVETLFEEQYSNSTKWLQRSVDLSHLAGKVVRLTMYTASPSDGTIGLWLTPTISGSDPVRFPNVVFYVIDGAGADWMSLYGYNRRTTPNLERLAAEGAVFEHAYSNATWTKVSTPSYMTSLYYSVLGGHRTHSDRIPDNSLTMAEHFGRAGYQTAVLTSNAYAATMSGLERGVDTVYDISVPHEAVSSEYLHRDFWRWRETSPGSPFWAHFQTTDVHEMFEPQAPFAGLYIDPEKRAMYRKWDQAVEDAGGYADRQAYEKARVSIEEHALAQQGLYDEAMAHQDHELGRFIERLKRSDEWENTLLVIASDHGYPAGGHRLMEPMHTAAPFLHPFATRIPLMFVWPGRIPGGQRFLDAVSMIDVLPTVLDLVGLPPPDVMQGQSLAPLLLHTGEWEPRPVIIDMFAMNFDTQELIGSIEIIDGRWGASLSINPGSRDEAPPNRGMHGDGLESHYTRKEPLVVYDLWNDPYLRHPINKERPDLVAKYRRLLEQQLEANKILAQRFQGGGKIDMTPEQLERLRALGYIE